MDSSCTGAASKYLTLDLSGKQLVMQLLACIAVRDTSGKAAA